MNKQDLGNFEEIGTPGCFYSGGGVWIAYIPIRAENGDDQLQLWYDSDSYLNDDPSVGEFTVYGNGEEPVLEYGDNGNYVDIKKNTPYYAVYEKLYNTMKIAYESKVEIDSIPIYTNEEARLEMLVSDIYDLIHDHTKGFPMLKPVKPITRLGEETLMLETVGGYKYTVTIRDYKD